MNISYLMNKSPAISPWVPLLNDIAEYSSTAVMCRGFPCQGYTVTSDVVILQGTWCCWHTYII